MTTTNWLNVSDFGAKLDGVTDDTPAIIAAVQACQKKWGGNVVYFPAGTCKIGSPLNLPTSNVRTTLLFDTQVNLDAPITIGDNYTLRGSTPSGKVAFATDDTTHMECGWFSGPYIHIKGGGVRLENFDIGYTRNASDGILVDPGWQVAFKNVWIASGGTGACVRLVGGFGYYFDGCGFSTGRIVWESDPRDNISGIFRMRDTYFAARGVTVNVGGGTNSMSFENILFEDAISPFIQINSPGGAGFYGLDCRGVNFADTAVAGGLPIVRAKGIRMGRISLVNCFTDAGHPQVDGDPLDNPANIW